MPKIVLVGVAGSELPRPIRLPKEVILMVNSAAQHMQLMPLLWRDRSCSCDPSNAPRMSGEAREGGVVRPEGARG